MIGGRYGIKVPDHFAKTLNYQSCVGRCNHTEIFSCRCDDLCSYFGDCCIDYDFICVQSNTSDFGDGITRRDVKIDEYQCVYDRLLKADVLLVTRCPEVWEDEFISSRCSGENDFSAHVYDYLGTNYFNIFCAFCHGHTLSQIHPWGTLTPDVVDLTCEDVDRAKFDIGNKLHLCNSFKYECEASNEKLSALCYKYDLPCLMRPETWYKNAFCAQCEHMDSTGFGNYGLLACRVDSGLRSTNLLFRFRNYANEKQDVDTQKPCLKGEILDPISSTCRPLTCNHGYAIRDGRCVLDNSTTMDGVLRGWTAGFYDSLLFVRCLLASLECVYQSLKDISIGDPDAEYVHPASFHDDDMWLSFRFNTNKSLEFFEEIDSLVKSTSKKCVINDVQLFLSYYHNITFDDKTCINRWIIGPVSNFVQIHHPTYNNIYLKDNTYVAAEHIMLHAKYELDTRGMEQRMDTMMLCGNEK